MPVLPTPDLKPPAFLFNQHLETIVPSLFRKVTAPAYVRERITTPDGDFLDLDWSQVGSVKLVILSHGLEGDSQRPYIRGMARTFAAAGYDVLAWNYRGCSGEINRLVRSYHSGATEDLEVVVHRALQKFPYTAITLIGFSLGGNLTLKYLGEKGKNLRPEIKNAITVSVPCDLLGSAKMLGTLNNFVYQRRFLKSLRQKLKQKQLLHPAEESLKNESRLADFFAFDNFYTAPAHGFAGAEAYYKACSSLYFLGTIQIPTLLINAQNDPFLSQSCFPVKEAEKSEFVFLEMPERGGHVGFCSDFRKDIYYSELRALQFSESHQKPAG
ncbi:MAG: alpha/beta fold hydrolase [Chitinophagaceae bacterium]|nr:MAG: alpha/beta fold hydrolase [Chitinophagaceae bacterium]